MKLYLSLLLTFFMHAYCEGVYAQTTPNTQTYFEYLSSPVNLVKNPHARLNTLNTTGGGAVTCGRSAGSSELFGFASHTITGTAINSYCQVALNAPKAPYDSPNMRCGAMLIYQGTGGSASYSLEVTTAGGSTTQQQLNSSSTWDQTTINLPCDAVQPTVRVIQTSAGTPGTLKYGIYYGPALQTTTKAISPDSFTATVGAGGAITGEGPIDWINGSCSVSDTSLVTCNFVNPFVSAPGCNISYVGSEVTAQVATQVQSVSTTSVVLRTGYSNTGNSFAKGLYSFNLTCRKTDPGSTQNIVFADNFEYGPRQYNPTFTGFGSVSGVDCTEARTRNENIIECKFVAGTTTATEARISLPQARVSSTGGSGTKPIGTYGRGYSGSANFGGFVLREPGVSYLTFSIPKVMTSSGGTINPLSKSNGNDIAASGDTVAFKVSVPIEGWDNYPSGVMVYVDPILKVVARSSSSQSIPNAAWTNLTSWTKDGDDSNTLNTSNGTFTAVDAGFYESEFQVTINTLAAGVTFAARISPSVGSATVISTTTSATSWNMVSVKWAGYLPAGGTIAPAVYQDSGSGKALPGSADRNIFVVKKVK